MLLNSIMIESIHVLESRTYKTQESYRRARY